MASFSQLDFVNIMEEGSNASFNLSELEILQKQHEEKIVKIKDLKRQIEALKLRFEKTKMMKKDMLDDRKEAFDNLGKKYNSLREEYYELLSEKVKGAETNLSKSL